MVWVTCDITKPSKRVTSTDSVQLLPANFYDYKFIIAYVWIQVKQVNYYGKE